MQIRIRRHITIHILIGIVFTSISCRVANPAEDKHIVVATMGASLMYPGNGWVEEACNALRVRCINKAVSSALPIHFAQLLWENAYATEQEIKDIDILLIQFANCKDVYGDATTFFPAADNYTRNYTASSDELFKEYSYAQQIDYILKKWQQICDQNNKPMHVIFVTHWHDGRVEYNTAVRKLAQRCNADVCELDKYIGFTKDQLLLDGTQPSVKYAQDTELIDGVTYGWHPLRGKDGSEIQHKMASILYDKLNNYITTHNIQ